MRRPQLLRLRALLAVDTWERHLIVARLVGSPADLIDVGGLPGQLRTVLPRTSVTAVNVSEPADIVVPRGDLPFSDGAFEAATSLDVIEHLPSAERKPFVNEVVRVARRRAVLCCPLGTPEHAAAEREMQAWYRSATGEDHPWLAEHLLNGLPSLDELHGIFARVGGHARFLFHGDFRDVNEQFKRIMLARYRRHVRDVVGFALFRLRYRARTQVDDKPSPWSNRVFVVVDPH